MRTSNAALGLGPDSPSARPRPAAPSLPLGDDAAERRSEIAARLATLDRDDHFQVLGVARDADSAVVRSAYFALAKRFHPDKQPEALADLKRDVARVFARLGEAFQVLDNPQKRAEYVASLAASPDEKPDESGTVERVVQAALDFQKAEALLKKHDLVGAELLAAKAAAADPEQPDYRTLLIWIRAQRRGEPPPFEEGKTTPFFDDLLRELDTIIAKEPRYERALFCRGMLLKRSGRSDRALRDFRLVAEINPKNIDAAREVRIAEMRKRAGGTADAGKDKDKDAGGGFLGRLFKK